MEVLVEVGYRLDVTDRFGFTPFAWACSLVSSFDGEALAAVIEAAVGTGTYDPQVIYEMWAHVMDRSAGRCQLTPLLMGFQSLRRAGFHAFARSTCLHALEKFMHRDEDDGNGSSEYGPQISKLLGMVLPDDILIDEHGIAAHDSSFRFRDTFWLVAEEKRLRKERCRVEDHLVKSLTLGSHVTALIKHGIDPAKYVSQSQKNALRVLLHTTLPASQVGAMQALLDCGVDPNHQDHRGHTPLHFLLRYFRHEIFVSLAEAEIVSKLLAGGACPAVRDKCRCSCAPSGCLATWEDSPLSGPVLPLKAIIQLSIVESLSARMAREVVLALIRRTKHELLGIPHVCCTRESESLPDFAAPLPPDDMNDIWEDEEEHIRNLDLDMEFHEEQIFEDLIEHWYQLILISRRRGQAELEQKVWPPVVCTR